LIQDNIAIKEILRGNMFCIKCGKELGPDEKFCSNCGTPVSTPRAVEAAAPPVPPVAPDVPVNDSPLPVQKTKTPFDITKALLLVGGILITAAVLTAVGTSWNSLGPIGRVMILLIPNILLFGIFAFLQNEKDHHDISSVVLGLGSFMVPFTIGTIIYQLNIITEIGSLLVLVSSGISLGVYIALDQFFKEKFLSYFVIIDAIFVLFAFFDLVKANTATSTWLFLLFSAGILFLGKVLADKMDERRWVYLAFGSIMTGFGVAAAYGGTLDLFNLVDSSKEAQLLGSLWCVFYLGFASVLYFFYQMTKTRAFYFGKRVIEELAVIFIIIFLLSAGGSEPVLLGLSLIASIVAIFASLKVNIKALLTMGIIGLIFSIFEIADKLFSGSAGFPVAIFISGFVAIGLAFWAKKITGTYKEKSLVPIWGLGVDYEVAKAASEKTKSVFMGLELNWKTGCLVLIVVWLILAFIGYVARYAAPY
jgi:hypothetical protein